MTLVDIQHVSRRYGRIQALSDVSLTLPEGTIGLVGNNGAGKSTLLKILLGLLRPDAGGGTILGCDILRASTRLRGMVGYMPETAAIVPMLKGVEFVTLSGDLYGMPHRDAKRRAHEVLGYVGLGELRYRKLEEYSTGNLQRLKLAAALVHDPQLLLLDEPTNGLDPEGRSGMLRMIQDLIAETGKSVILCTHLLGDVERLCEHVVVLHRGTVVRSGVLSELRRGASDCYELGWQGEGEAFLQKLQAAGIAVVERQNGALIKVAAPPEWDSGAFFGIARQAGVVVTHLKPDEEDLQGLFFRVTAAAPAAQREARRMAIDTSHYHGWHGPLRGPWAASLAMVRVALLQVFRRKLYWLVIGTGMFQFLLFWALIYAVTQFQLPDEVREGIFRVIKFSPSPDDAGENGYVTFMQNQSIVVAILLAFSGSVLVGNDFRQGALPFYLSRRIDRRHYIVAKLLAISTVIALLTVVPALLLFFEFGMFTSSTVYWRENWRIVVSILGYGAVLCTVLSICLVTVSAWLQRAAPIAITWTSAFILLSALGDRLENEFGSRYLRLIDLWRDMRLVGRLLFDTVSDDNREMAWYALFILVSVCTLATIALVHRVRAVDVVE